MSVDQASGVTPQQQIADLQKELKEAQIQLQKLRAAAWGAADIFRREAEEDFGNGRFIATPTMVEILWAELNDIPEDLELLRWARENELADLREECFRMRAFFERVRSEAHEDPELYYPFARLALQFNAGSIEPLPCQGCERLRAELADEQKCRQLQVAEIERLDAFVSKVRAILDREYDGREFEDIANAVANVDPGTEPTPVAEPVPCPECERLREQLTAAEAAVSFQRAGIERLQAFAEKIRVAHYCDNWPSITMALDTLDAGTEPAPVAEPAPQSELSEQGQDSPAPSWAPLIADLRQRLAAAQAALTRERLDAELRGHELERLRAFVSLDMCEHEKTS